MTDPVPFHLADQKYDAAASMSKLHEHPGNYNVGAIEVIAESLDSHGFYGAIIAQKSTGTILAGNHRFRVAQDKGASTIPVFWIDCDDDEANRILAVDNGSARLATFDEAALISLLTPLADSPQGLRGTAWTSDMLGALVRRQKGLTASPSDPEDEWDDMPEFNNPGSPAAYSIVMHFPSEEDAEVFFGLIGRERPKTRFLWWPHGDGRKGMVNDQVEVVDDGPDES